MTEEEAGMTEGEAEVTEGEAEVTNEKVGDRDGRKKRRGYLFRGLF
ncbi:hypothetical protein H5U35_01795 [Candidatus Aerophobetes bacterium]|nr:hypothetical protein [Candidatus Aerophobetes bacterium]